MRKWIPAFELHVLAFDNDVTNCLSPEIFPEVKIVSLADFENRNPDVAATKAVRTRAEYFFTCTGAWTYDVLHQHPMIDILSYIDVDICFFAPAESIFEELGNGSILITEHHFHPAKQSAIIYGRYNVGLLCFRNSIIGLACLKKWRNQCVEWCYDRLEDGKFADQKYLDVWPELYGKDVVVTRQLVNLGPWGLQSDDIRLDNGCIYIGSEGNLIAYHFQGVRQFSKRHYYLGFYFPFCPINIIQYLYDPYIEALNRVNKQSNLCNYTHGRYGKQGILYQMTTGYWFNNSSLCRLVWWVHHYLLRL
ncbi:MAG: hypothetical protein WCJ02_02165 [bacterium]